jgi:hypothetical protein
MARRSGLRALVDSLADRTLESARQYVDAVSADGARLRLVPGAHHASRSGLPVAV